MAKFPENGTPAERAAHMREWGCGGCQRGASIIDALSAEIDALAARLAEHDRLHAELNAVLHPNGDGPPHPSLCDLVAYVRGDRARLAEAEAKRDAWRTQFNQCSERWQDSVLELGNVRWIVHEFVTEGDKIRWLNNTDWWESWGDRLHTISDARPPRDTDSASSQPTSASVEGEK